MNLGSHFNFISHSIFNKWLVGFKEWRKQKKWMCLHFIIWMHIPRAMTFFFFSSTFTHLKCLLCFLFLFECNFFTFIWFQRNIQREHWNNDWKTVILQSALHFNVRTVNYEFEPYSQSIECIELCNRTCKSLSYIFLLNIRLVYNILSMFIFRLRLRHHVYVYSSRIEGVVWKPTCNAFTLHFKIIAIFFSPASALTDRLKMQTDVPSKWFNDMSSCLWNASARQTDKTQS